MKTLKELSDSGLTWVEQKGRILLQDEQGGTLGEMRRAGRFTGRFEVDAQGNRWSFERKGFRRPHIEIRSLGTGDEPARFEYKGREGTLRYPDGTIYHWRGLGAMGRQWLWTDAEDQPVLGIEVKGSWQMRGEIRIDPAQASDKAPSLLLFLGWHLIHLYNEDSAAVVATMAVMG
jgi:hypothetical protein